MSTVSFALDHGRVIHVAGRLAEQGSGEAMIDYNTGQPDHPFCLTLVIGLNERFEAHFSVLQAARLARYLLRRLAERKQINHITDDNPDTFQATT